MQPIQSIIVFTGGSAGDLLKALCLNQDGLHEVSHAGRIDLHQEYFKDVAEWVYKKQMTVEQMDASKLSWVENSHHYMDFFHDVARHVYFIDYPNQLARSILEIYIEKREHGNPENFLNNHRYSIPVELQRRVTPDNVVDVFEKIWIKNLNSWRNNSQMTAVKLQDFFNSSSMKLLVEQVSGRPITDLERFNQHHQAWLDKNHRLRQLFF